MLEVHRDVQLDALDVLVEPKPEHSGDTATIAAELQHHIKSFIGISSRVRVVSVGEIERSMGKAKRVIDKRSQS